MIDLREIKTKVCTKTGGRKERKKQNRKEISYSAYLLNFHQRNRKCDYEFKYLDDTALCFMPGKKSE